MVLCLMDSAQGTEVSILLGYDEAPLGDWLSTFRDDIVVVLFGGRNVQEEWVQLPF